MKDIHKTIRVVEYAIEQYKSGSPFKDFCDEETLIELCDHFIENYHRSMKMSDSDRILENYFRNDVDF